MKTISCLIMGACALTLLTGCSGTADALGLGRNTPDEFAVVDRPPLSLPPSYDLRPPQPGAPRPQEVSMPKRASQILFGAESQDPLAASAAQEKSDAEKALLSSAGADKANPAIRQTIDQDSRKIVGSRHLVRDLLGMESENSSGTTVDPAAEAQRLREAKEKGEAATASPTPVIEKGSSGWLF